MDYLEGKILAHDVVDTSSGELHRERQRRAHEDNHREAHRCGHQEDRDAVRQRPRPRRVHLEHAADRLEHEQARGARRDLPHDAPRRAADEGSRREPVPEPVLQQRALRPFGRRPHEVQPPRRPQRVRRPRRAQQGRHHRRPEDADRHPQRQRHGRRHRPLGQPPRAQRRRDGRERVPHRLGARRARRQGAPHARGVRRLDAAGDDQREARGRGRQGVLRLEPAVAVHGPEQPAVGSHAQAARFGAWTRRPDARARGLRGPRRASDALRPRVPDRDAGRSEHRLDQLAVRLRADERVRFPRDAVSPRHGRQGHGRDRLSVGDRGRPIRHRAGERGPVPEGRVHGRPRVEPPSERVRAAAGRPDPVHGRLAEADRVRRRVADSVPRARRREPRVDGLEHAAASGADAAHGDAARRHGHGARRGRRLGRDGRRAPRRRRRFRRRVAYRRSRQGRRDEGRRGRRRHLQPDEVHALEPEHLHQSAAARQSGQRDREG